MEARRYDTDLRSGGLGAMSLVKSLVPVDNHIKPGMLSAIAGYDLIGTPETDGIAMLCR